MDRPTIQTIWMNLAISLSTRSTCKRKKVGTVVTSEDMEQVLSVGYNGNAKGFDNTCDTDEAGNCGCIHSENNALIKSGSRDNKVVFVSLSPCKHCAKLMINANVKTVYFREYYRDITGLNILVSGGVKVYWLREDGIIAGPLNSSKSDKP